MTSTLIVPGLGDSRPGHWQSWLEERATNASRVTQPDWGLPDLDAWATLVASAVTTSLTAPVVVAHSFGVLATVHAAAKAPRRIAAALLVAPADPDVFGYANLLPTSRLPFPTILVASRTDPWISFDSATLWAARWGSRLVDLGNAGHINIESGHGAWPEGLALYQNLEKTCRRQLVAAA